MSIKEDDVFQVNLTPNQVEAIIKALDVYVRLSIGQFEIIGEEFRFENFKVRDTESNNGRKTTFDENEHIDNILKSLKRFVGHPFNGNFGIGNHAVSNLAHINYEVLKTLQKSFAYARNPRPDFKGVNYDGVTVRYSNEPVPEVTFISPSDENDETPADDDPKFSKKF